MATLVVYSGSGAGGAGVDGYVGRNQSDVWSAIHDGAGNSVNVGGTSTYVYLTEGGSSNLWDTIRRSIFVFDTSGLGSGATVSAATLSVFGTSKAQDLPYTPEVAVVPYGATPASNTNLAASDYGQCGSTAFASGITITNYSTTAYNDFALNSSGLANISPTGYSPFSIRANYDGSNTEPGWTGNGGLGNFTQFAMRSADQAGTTNDPKLTITYTGGAVPVVATPSTAALVLTTFAPSVLAPLLATPPTAALVLTTFAPTVTISANVTATAGTAALVLTTFAPTVLTPRTATPPTAALVLTTFAPTVTISAGVVATPPTASLVLTTFAPTVSVTANVTATPLTSALVLTTFAPTVLTPRLVTPPIASLSLATFAPTVSVTLNVTVTPPTAALVLTTFPPTVTFGTSVTATPGTAALVLTTFRPTVTATAIAIAGTTRNAAGIPLANCVVKLYRTSTDAVVGQTVSDAAGHFSIPVHDGDAYYAVAYLDGSPDIAGTTVNTLVGVP